MKRVAKHRARKSATATRASVARPRLTVGDIMTSDVITVSADASLREMVDLLADEHISGAPVVAGGRLVGVISASDILRFQASTPAVPAERPDQVEQGEWGTPTEWEEEAEAPGAFFTEMWGDVGADVSERFGQIGGPEWDLLEEHTVAEAMTRRVCSVSVKEEVADAAAYMLRVGVHRLVVRDDGAPVGIVTTTDIMRAVAERKVT